MNKPAATCRLNLRVSGEEHRLIKMAADVYTGGNITRLIKQLIQAVPLKPDKQTAKLFKS